MYMSLHKKFDLIFFSYYDVSTVVPVMSVQFLYFMKWLQIKYQK